MAPVTNNVPPEPGSISRATPADIAALNALVNSAYRGDSSRVGWTTEADLLDGQRIDEAMLAEIFHDPDSVLLKYALGEEIVGCVHVKFEADKLYLGMLTVSPVLQSKGIGKALLHAAEHEAISAGCTTIYMTVIADRKELIAWYVRHGYTNTGQTKPFPAGDERFGIPRKPLEFVVLEKSLHAHDM